jgi:hypothetical protein
MILRIFNKFSFLAQSLHFKSSKNNRHAYNHYGFVAVVGIQSGFAA